MHTTLHSTVRALGLGALAGIALLAAGCSKEPSTDKITTGDMTLGNPSAPIKVVEYASVACPICARMNHDAMPQFTQKYVDTGKVYYVYRPMMTGNQAVAVAGHLLAQCAGKDKMFKVVDAIMRSQEEMDQGGPPEQYTNARPVLLRIANSVGLSEGDFNTCVTNAKGIEQLNAINDKALKDDGVDGTPTFFVNGKKIAIQKYDISDLDNAIQPLLKK